MTAAIAESIVGRLDSETLLGLSRREDPLGVLSVYVDARPRGGPREASIEIKNRLSELERHLASGGSPDLARAVRDRVAQLAPDLERLTDPEAPGRGRVLFAAMGDMHMTRLSSRLPVPNRVVLDRRAFIHPLLELLDEGRPVGVVLASRNEGRLLEWRLGELTPLGELRADLLEPPHERSGPIGSRPANRHGTPTGEQRNARERDRSARFIERIAATVSRLAPERGWERVLVSGGEQLTEALVSALPTALRETALCDPRMLVRLKLTMLAEVATERVRTSHRKFERQLIRTVREEAHGAGMIALGLSEVAGALNEARVDHLIYDPFIRYQGSVAPDGTLYAGGEAAPARVWTPDPHLTERLVERALETGARVTPAEGAASDGLADASGIAAVLRW